MSEGDGGGGLSEAETALVELAAEMATGEAPRIRRALRAAAGRAPDRAVEETVLQAHLFLGFPVVLSAMAVWREVRRPRSPGGDAVGHGAAEEPEDPATVRRRGEALCRRVYGDAYDLLRERVRRLHPELDRWMVEVGYGRVLSRPGLEPATRELCIVAALTVTGWEAQLHSHLRGALHLGAEPAAVEAALEVGRTRVADAAWHAAAGDLWQRVLRRNREGRVDENT